MGKGSISTNLTALNNEPLCYRNTQLNLSLIPGHSWEHMVCVFYLRGTQFESEPSEWGHFWQIEDILGWPPLFQGAVLRLKWHYPETLTPMGVKAIKFLVFSSREKNSLNSLCYNGFLSNTSRNISNTKMIQILPVVLTFFTHFFPAINTVFFFLNIGIQRKWLNSSWPQLLFSISDKATNFLHSPFKPCWVREKQALKEQLENLGSTRWSICSLAKS